MVNAHEEELTRAIRVTDRLSRGIGGSYSVYAVMYLVFGSIDADARDKFFDQLDSGANLSEGSPILSYRRMFSELRRRTGGKYRVEQTEHSALLIKAWNAWRQGRVLRRLMWRDGEDFPVPV